MKNNHHTTRAARQRGEKSKLKRARVTIKSCLTHDLVVLITRVPLFTVVKKKAWGPNTSKDISLLAGKSAVHADAVSRYMMSEVTDAQGQCIVIFTEPPRSCIHHELALMPPL